jgi:hypothetical protein
MRFLCWVQGFVLLHVKALGLSEQKTIDGVTLIFYGDLKDSSYPLTDIVFNCMPFFVSGAN